MPPLGALPGRLALVLALVLGIMLLVAACAQTVPPSPQEDTPVPTPSVLAGMDPTDQPCPDSTWPPFDVPRPAGISAVATDSRHVDITSHLASRVYFRLSSWQVLQQHTCRGIVQNENVSGPLEPGQIFTADITVAGDDPTRPLTLAIWDQACGEGCHRPPDAALLVPPSLVQPIATD